MVSLKEYLRTIRSHFKSVSGSKIKFEVLEEKFIGFEKSYLQLQGAQSTSADELDKLYKSVQEFIVQDLKSESLNKFELLSGSQETQEINDLLYKGKSTDESSQKQLEEIRSKYNVLERLLKMKEQASNLKEEISESRKALEALEDKHSDKAEVQKDKTPTNASQRKQRGRKGPLHATKEEVTVKKTADVNKRTRELECAIGLVDSMIKEKKRIEITKKQAIKLLRTLEKTRKENEGFIEGEKVFYASQIQKVKENTDDHKTETESLDTLQNMKEARYRIEIVEKLILEIKQRITLCDNEIQKLQELIDKESESKTTTSSTKSEDTKLEKVEAKSPTYGKKR
ncbi:hypothetical protein [Wolbachia endosymbiont of Ctenocephalides felis wCfeT]|uniref:hypothetical protein n=1 Tax=Wolbachia endosymbiont of Ctenocephalides felis wCfeT TaxID=2732593 RepID=UPI0014473AE7|nr:hypothetical protein [Wolbachia endosymbiont of Ctenocephalides felis wCfeT]